MNTDITLHGIESGDEFFGPPRVARLPNGRLAIALKLRTRVASTEIGVVVTGEAAALSVARHLEELAQALRAACAEAFARGFFGESPRQGGAAGLHAASPAPPVERR